MWEKVKLKIDKRKEVVDKSRKKSKSDVYNSKFTSENTEIKLVNYCNKVLYIYINLYAESSLLKLWSYKVI